MLMPEVREITVAEAYDSGHRRRRSDRPWIVLSMISTADGAVSLEGSSALLGGPTDRDVFLHLHRSGDSVLVGAETVRADVYSPLPTRQELVIVSASGDLGRNADALLAADNTRIVSGDVRDIVATLPGDVCILEGGPTLNGQMLAADLVDEVCLTIAPRFIAGRSDRVAEGPWAMRELWHVAHVCEEDGYLFVRYLRSTELGE
jgi:riboflavin biosynthesis pyrimidine reductase